MNNKISSEIPLDKISKILYALAMDMDVEDYEELREVELSCIEFSLQRLIDTNDMLFKCLELIALNHEEWYEQTIQF